MVSYGSPAAPEAVLRGACAGSAAQGWAPVGAMQFHVELEPEAEETLLLGLGYVENPEEEKFSAPGVINKRLAHELMELTLQNRSGERKGAGGLPVCGVLPLGRGGRQH